jgi:hypothetical protein
MTPREFAELRDVWLEGIERQKTMHAEMIAEMYNIHTDTGGVPYNAADVLGKGDRAKRKMQMMRDRVQGFRDAGQIAKGEGAVPDWALQVAELAKERQKVN